MKKDNKISGIKSWPVDDRPREKLLKKGAGTLSNSELLAILLRTGTAGTSAVELSRKILEKFGNRLSPYLLTEQELRQKKGLEVIAAVNKGLRKIFGVC